MSWVDGDAMLVFLFGCWLLLLAWKERKPVLLWKLYVVIDWPTSLPRVFVTVGRSKEDAWQEVNRYALTLLPCCALSPGALVSEIPDEMEDSVIKLF